MFQQHKLEIQETVRNTSRRSQQVARQSAADLGGQLAAQDRRLAELGVSLQQLQAQLSTLDQVQSRLSGIEAALQRLEEIERKTQELAAQGIAKTEGARHAVLTEMRMDRGYMDIRRKLQVLATETTADYVKTKMAHVQSVDHKFKVHDAGLAAVTLDGLAMEFGVHSGRTINYIAQQRPDWTVHGFDSFEGLPEAWRDGFDAGEFATDKLPPVRDNIRLHVGWFSEAIPRFIEEHVAQDDVIAYIHIDCDLYSSTKDIFRLLGERMRPGTVIVFDEYFNYDGWERGEFLAFREFLEEFGLNYEYLTYNYKHENVAVKLT
ncbi:class I SAM-dependent methyltransferase [Pseudooceanicola sp. LIPI14-2-Ac024]|uniref:class I SAM-dependent methyltransferase n=1 Tax=Pseudooceanicola sp. LIPI14-2-Ac024 TaxID=3344875 RepID=UPI0035D0DEDC